MRVSLEQVERLLCDVWAHTFGDAAADFAFRVAPRMAEVGWLV